MFLNYSHSSSDIEFLANSKIVSFSPLEAVFSFVYLSKSEKFKVIN